MEDNITNCRYIQIYFLIYNFKVDGIKKAVNWKVPLGRKNLNTPLHIGVISRSDLAPLQKFSLLKLLKVLIVL